MLAGFSASWIWLEVSVPGGKVAPPPAATLRSEVEMTPGLVEAAVA